MVVKLGSTYYLLYQYSVLAIAAHELKKLDYYVPTVLALALEENPNSKFHSLDFQISNLAFRI